MDTLDYQLIQAIAEERSLTAAARRLGMSGSGIGQRLTKLENQLGQMLVHRQHRTQLTKAGEAFLATAIIILKEVDALKINLADIRNNLQSFSLMVNPSIAISDLIDVFDEMVRLNPQLKPVLTKGSTKDIINAVLSGSVEAGIVVGSHNVPGLQFTPYKRDRFCIVVPVSHALAQMPIVKLRDALKHPLIGVTSKQINQYLLEIAKQYGVNLNYRMVVSSFEAQMHFAAQTDIGIAVVAESLARRFQKSHPLKIINLDRSFDFQEFTICMPEKGFASDMSIEFTRHLINRFKMPR